MSGKKGFLLLEVVVSIVLITGGLLFVMRAYSTSKRSMDRSGEILKSSLLVRGAIFPFEERDAIEDYSEKGSFESDDEYSWQLNSGKAEEKEGLNLVKLDVFNRRSPRLSSYSIVTYMKNKSGR